MGQGRIFVYFPMEMRGVKCYDDISSIVGPVDRRKKGGDTVEYLDMVNQIITAEHSAKALAEEGRQKQEQVESGVEREVAQLREDYMQRARHRLELVEETEQAGAEEEIVKLDEVQRRAMKAVEAAYEKNRDAWVDKLFALIVGVEP